MSKDSKEVATTSKPGVPALYDYGANANRGFSKTTQSDFAMPFIAILQSNSPQIADESERIPGAVPGMLHNTVTNRVTDGKKGIIVVPCHTEHVFTEWVPRSKGGGFSGRHELGSEVIAEAINSGRRSEKGNRPLLKNGNELVETFYVYALILDEAGAADFSEMVVLAFTSTKIKKYKKMMTTLRTCKPLAGAPLFAHQLRVKTVQESNAQGTFYNFDIEPALTAEGVDPVVASAIPPVLGEQPHPILVAGAKLEEQVVGGLAKPNYDSQGKAEGGGSADSVF